MNLMSTSGCKNEKVLVMVAQHVNALNDTELFTKKTVKMVHFML